MDEYSSYPSTPTSPHYQVQPAPAPAPAPAQVQSSDDAIANGTAAPPGIDNSATRANKKAEQVDKAQKKRDKKATPDAKSGKGRGDGR